MDKISSSTTTMKSTAGGDRKEDKQKSGKDKTERSKDKNKGQQQQSNDAEDADQDVCSLIYGLRTKNQIPKLDQLQSTIVNQPQIIMQLIQVVGDQLGDHLCCNSVELNELALGLYLTARWANYLATGGSLDVFQSKQCRASGSSSSSSSDEATSKNADEVMRVWSTYTASIPKSDNKTEGKRSN